MKKIIFIIIVLLFVGCATTQYKTKEQLQKEHKGIKYFDKADQIEVTIGNAARMGRTYLYCYKSNGFPYDGAPDNIPSDIEDVKIIGIYEWVAPNEASFLKRGMDSPKECSETYYVCKAENYGYVFFPKNSLDSQIAYSKKRQEQIKDEQKYDAHLDKLKAADRELIVAVNGGFYDYMERAIKDGANVNVKDLGGNTPLILASARGFDEMVEYLLRKKANVNAANNEKLTALIAASANGHVEIVRLLLAYKANVNLRTSFGMSAYDIAKLNNNTPIMFLLRSAGAK